MYTGTDTVAHTGLQECAVVIPAYQPDERLVELAEALADAGFAAIIVVNDGSSHKHEEVFKRVSAIASAIVLGHAANCGQGSAVKTGLKYTLDCMPHLSGVVTADADGQHAPADVVRVAKALSGNTPVLGTRRFDGEVPLRSRFGNLLTRYVFWLLSGVMITDTQSGLRGIPRTLIPAVLRVGANQYEFAVALLALFCRIEARPVEVPIATIYLDGNRSSHFKPMRDAVRIYWHLARCFASVLIPAGVDFAGFAIVYARSGSLSAAMLAGRLPAIASRALLELTRTPSLLRHAMWLTFTGCLAFAAIDSLARGIGWNPLATKVPIEFSLFLLPHLLRFLGQRSVFAESVLSRLL
jgi:glycosyltransferase involved in cell wall biosynthesis